MKQRVLLTCTTTGSVHMATAAALISVTKDDRYQVDIAFFNDRPYESAMNKIAAGLVAGQRFDWWLHTDNDQAWVKNPLDTLAAMMDVGNVKDLVGFPAPIYRPGGQDSLIITMPAWDIVDDSGPYPKVQPVVSDGGIKRVDLIGSGSFLLRVAALRDAKIKEPFTRTFDEDGVTVAGCDIEFCRKWREAGLTVWCDFGSPMEHHKSVDLLHVLHDLSRVQKEAGRKHAIQEARNAK